MILVDKDIMMARERGEIIVDPWDEEALGTNSYDVHLAPVLRFYPLAALDCRQKASTLDIRIPDGGLVLQPGELYLASTIEYTESHRHVPMLNGKSSIGRLGLSIHVTAGTGDIGFCNHWTMELFVVKPLRVYAWMAIGQLLWFEPTGKPDVPYGDKRSAKYAERSALPQPSEMAANFRKP